MAYSIDFASLDLNYLHNRLMHEDLIPSQLPLQHHLIENLELLKANGISKLSQLHDALKKDSDIKNLSKQTGIDSNYLKLLRRALRGYTPKPAKLADYPHIDVEAITILDKHGSVDSCTFWTAAYVKKDRQRIASETNISLSILDELICLTDLSRIQWVSAIFSRSIYNSGYKTVEAVSSADSEHLAHSIAETNQREQLFKGRIGIRDIRRLIFLASHLSHEIEL